MRQTRVILQQFFFRYALGEIVEDKGHPDARAADAGFAEADARINR